MKKGMLLSVVILLCASLAFAQLPGGAIGVYADDLGESCNFTDSGPGVVVFHFYHLACPGAIAVEFILNYSAFANGPFYGDSSPFVLKQGGFTTGVSIAYGGCLSGNIYLGSAAFGSSGGTPACSYVYIEPHPVPSQPGSNPLAVSCTGPFMEVWGGSGTINSTTCPCTGSVPNQETSWGQIKSLYQ